MDDVPVASGYRFTALSHGDFAQRYARMCRQEVARAQDWNFVPDIGPLIAAVETKKANEAMEQRQFRAEQKALRPGVVPTGGMVWGYLVFAWPEEMQPGQARSNGPHSGPYEGRVATMEFEAEGVERKGPDLRFEKGRANRS